MTIERIDLEGNPEASRIQMLRVAEWSPTLLHGAIGSTLDFGPRGLAASAKRLCECFGACGLLTVSQVHGAEIVDLTISGEVERLCAQLCEEGEAHRSAGTGDALLIPLKSSCRTAMRLLAGIRTADCVPMMVRSDRICAIVHAGWRGVAAGIVERVMTLFRGEADPQVFIAPCAGGGRYEVGAEVVAAVEGERESTAQRNGKFLLDLGTTVARRVVTACPCQVHRIAQCTIESTQWHSYRRDGALSGRNLLFAECAFSG